MNQKELNEIRRRFRLDKNNFSHIFGCYVNSNREVISWIDASLGLMRQEEQEMYLGLLKKTLSGTLGATSSTLHSRPLRSRTATSTVCSKPCGWMINSEISSTNCENKQI